ncbi:MAG: hypothetical protein ABI847_02945 [Anaerolineales bacterium]
MPVWRRVRTAFVRRWLSRSGLALAALALAACATAQAAPELVLQPRATQRPVIPTAEGSTSVSVAVVAATPSPVPEGWQGGEGLDSTAADYTISVGTDSSGAKTAAFTTLKDFINPHGIYSRAWWLADDGHASLAEAIAVILYTEGNTAFDVRTAVVARFLWYCGGLGSTCQGANLINYLSYFQPWREPWNANFTSENAKKYLAFADDLVHQAPGLLTAIIPGADTYVQSQDGLSLGGPIDWNRTKFHFANVDPTWDAYLRQALRRLPDGPNRLWVLTMGDAAKVCGSQFLCADMTQPRP